MITKQILVVSSKKKKKHKKHDEYESVRLGFHKEAPKKSDEYESVRLGFKRKKKYRETKAEEQTVALFKDTRKDGDTDPEHTKNIQDLHNRLSKHYTFKEHPFDFEDEVGPIISYTNNSGSLNEHLYANKGKPKSAIFKDRVKHLDRVLRKHKTPEDMHVYTGVKREHNLHEIGRGQGAREVEGGTKPIKVVHHGYTSTSINKNVAVGFAHHQEANDGYKQHILKIHLPKGSRGAYVEHHSNVTGEKEFVLPRSTKLHIHPKPEIHESHDNKNQGSKFYYHVWNAHVVKDKPKAKAKKK